MDERAGKPHDGFVEDKLGCISILIFLAVCVAFALWVAWAS